LGPHIKVGKSRMYYMDARKSLFSHSVIGCWNSLDQETVDASSINALKSRLDKLRHVRIGFFVDYM